MLSIFKIQNAGWRNEEYKALVLTRGLQQTSMHGVGDIYAKAAGLPHLECTLYLKISKINLYNQWMSKAHFYMMT